VKDTQLDILATECPRFFLVTHHKQNNHQLWVCAWYQENKGEGCCISDEDEEAESHTSAEQTALLVLLSMKQLMDRYGDLSDFQLFPPGVLQLNQYVGNLE